MSPHWIVRIYFLAYPTKPKEMLFRWPNSTSIKFTKDGHTYILTATTPKPPSTKNKIPHVHMNQCVSLCLVRSIPPNLTPHLVPEAINPLIQESTDVFQTPTGLPPSRHIDHSIHLIPGPSLPNAPTYRLATRETEVKEKQLTDLINSDHLQPTSAPCATAKFMRLINDICNKHLGSIVGNYLDDILIFSWTWDTHL